MEYNESNFFYLRKTSMDKYYDELVKAESVCEYFPKVTKIIVRKVMEIFLKDLAEKNSIEASAPVWNLFNNIKSSSNIILSEEVYNYIEIILVNGYDHTSYNNKSRRISKHPIEILEIIHNILCWYLRKTELETVMLLGDLSFRAPSTIEYMEKQVGKINDDILFKNNQINNLRQKIIESDSQYKNIGEINNTIIVIKEEKAYLERLKELLHRKIEIQKKHVSEVEKNYKTYIKRCDELKENCNESQELLFEKESQLVKVEIQKQELKNLISKLDEQDESIRKMELSLDQEIKILRQAYENLLNLTTEYQDILETVEFSYDAELQTILEAKKKNIKVKMNYEDTIFNENIIDCTRNIVEAKRKIIIFKEILNEKINRNIKYELFYRSFLELKDKKLRIIYIIINLTANLLSKPKELFVSSNEDKILESITKNIEELKYVDDDEIKLILYYKLVKLSQISSTHIYSRKQFINNLDSMVDKSYEILTSKKDFNWDSKKIDGVIAYYLQKLITFIKGKLSNQPMNEELVFKIYDKILELRHISKNIGKIFYEKINIDSMSEIELKTNIKSQPYIFLSILVELGDINSYKEISMIIFEIYSRMVQKVNGYNEKNLAMKFTSEYFMILLFVANETAFLIQKQQEELLPLIVAEIIYANFNFVEDNDTDNLENYNKMVALWKHKQQRYNDIFAKKEEEESVLESLIKERNELKINLEELIRVYNILLQNYSSYKDEFKKIIMNSEKRILLPSYMIYEELRAKKEKAESKINMSKDKFGTLKSIVSPTVWKEQASKFISESNMEEVEKLLIEEAKQKPYFKKEYSVFADLEEKIKNTNELIEKNKKDFEWKKSSIVDAESKINELEKKLKAIKDIYVDVEEGYY